MRPSLRKHLQVSSRSGGQAGARYTHKAPSLGLYDNVPLGYTDVSTTTCSSGSGSSPDNVCVWIASADEVTSYSQVTSGALLQCTTKYCEVRKGSSDPIWTEPPILRLGSNVVAAATDIAGDGVIIVQLENLDTLFYCGGSGSRQCTVESLGPRRPPSPQPPPAPSPPPRPPRGINCTQYTRYGSCAGSEQERPAGFGGACFVSEVYNQCAGDYCAKDSQCASENCACFLPPGPSGFCGVRLSTAGGHCRE